MWNELTELFIKSVESERTANRITHSNSFKILANIRFFSQLFNTKRIAAEETAHIILLIGCMVQTFVGLKPFDNSRGTNALYTYFMLVYERINQKRNCDSGCEWVCVCVRTFVSMLVFEHRNDWTTTTTTMAAVQFYVQFWNHRSKCISHT